MLWIMTASSTTMARQKNNLENFFNRWVTTGEFTSRHLFWQLHLVAVQSYNGDFRSRATRLIRNVETEPVKVLTLLYQDSEERGLRSN